MEKLKISTGKCWVYKHPECLQLRVGDGLGFVIGELYENASKRVKMDEAIANATLFADSINSYQECNLLPSKLLEERRKLMIAIKLVMDGLENGANIDSIKLTVHNVLLGVEQHETA